MSGVDRGPASRLHCSASAQVATDENDERRAGGQNEAGQGTVGGLLALAKPVGTLLAAHGRDHGARIRAAFLEVEDQRECFVYGSELIGVETPGGPPQALGVDNRGLLDEDAGLGVVQ